MPVSMAPNPIPPGSMGRKFRVLGVDPAVSGATGYGVIEFDGPRPNPMHFGVWRLPSRMTFAVRLREIHSLVSGLVEQFAPDAVAVESDFAALNVGTALKLAEMRGVVLLAAAQAQIPAHSYSPREVKASVAGFGAASKQQIQHMVRSLLNLPQVPEPADAADALAVALCHAQALRVRDLLTPVTSQRPLASAAAAGARMARVFPSRAR